MRKSPIGVEEARHEHVGDGYIHGDVVGNGAMHGVDHGVGNGYEKGATDRRV